MRLIRLLLLTVVVGVIAAADEKAARETMPKRGSKQTPATEVKQTRENLDYWLENMHVHHGYSIEEIMKVCELPRKKIEKKIEKLGWQRGSGKSRNADGTIKVFPYPGGRHPRIGFLEGAIDPQRGTKASIFLPWENSGYAVLDLPEAIFSNLGLTFLAHTHIPTIWDDADEIIENVDWTLDGNDLRMERTLPNGIKFGASIEPKTDYVALDLWLENGSPELLSGMRTQVCLMLKGAPAFNEQTKERNTMEAPVAAVKAKGENNWILIAFNNCKRVWNNVKCPCIHSDPFFPDAAAGQRVSSQGRLWFYKGDDVEQEIARGKELFTKKGS